MWPVAYMNWQCSSEPLAIYTIIIQSFLASSIIFHECIFKITSVHKNKHMYILVTWVELLVRQKLTVPDEKVRGHCSKSYLNSYLLLEQFQVIVSLQGRSSLQKWLIQKSYSRTRPRTGGNYKLYHKQHVLNRKMFSKECVKWTRWDAANSEGGASFNFFFTLRRTLNKVKGKFGLLFFLSRQTLTNNFRIMVDCWAISRVLRY